MSNTPLSSHSLPPGSGTQPTSALGLGIDAGGTQTRWALANEHGALITEGHVSGLSALLLNSDDGRKRITTTLESLAEAVYAHGKPTGIYAGVTGLDDAETTLAPLIAKLFGLDAHAVKLGNDVEVAFLDVFAPGEGYLVYAGTGSIAAYIDKEGAFHRAGGRGVVLDDGGGGFWIAREALRHVWRAEDALPGAWQQSLLAQKIFAHIGGDDWSFTRKFIYQNERGEIGKLALAVAAAADEDADARHILECAGQELARLANAMARRFGTRKVVLSGRVAHLHPLIISAMQAALPINTPFEVKVSDAHHAAARIAAKYTAKHAVK
jgi:glucosamine kinase